MHPNLLVGIETRDDAGVFRLSEHQALVQTIDFFTPVVDDPYSYGCIAAANALSDVYAMGGVPLTVLNVACFDPSAAAPEVWSEVLRGMADKTIEAGAIVLGGHSVEDKEPKFGMAVTGLVDPERMFANTNAKPGDRIFLSKPLGTGIVTTAAKFDACTPDELKSAIDSMATLNASAAQTGIAAGVQCATDITGFGLAGHLLNIARESGVSIEISATDLPVLPGVQRMVEEGHTTGGGAKNMGFAGDRLMFDEAVPDWLRAVVVDPQTSGGLALFSGEDLAPLIEIGRVSEGSPGLNVVL